MTEWSLSALWAQAWDLIEDAPGKLMVLATRDSASVAARNVVIRNIDRDAAYLTFHTDARSAKVGQISAHPHAEGVIWHPNAQCQIRVQLNILFDDPEHTQRAQTLLPAHSYKNYAVEPAPGTPIAHFSAVTYASKPTNFLALKGIVNGLEIVMLSHDPHLRARYSRQHSFKGQWLAP